MTPERSRGAALVGLAVGVPTSALFLWLAFRNADLTLVRATLEQARAGLVALAIGCFAALYGFQAVRWRKIASASQVRVARFYEMVVSGAACNNVLPVRIGDLLRARWLGLEARMPAGRAFGTVMLDRGCDLAVLFALMIVGLAAVASSDWLVYLAVGSALALGVLGAVILFARIYVRRRERGRRRRGLARRLVRDAGEALAEPLGRRRVATWLALSLGAWTMWAVGAILVARSLSIELSVGDALFVAAVMNLGSAIPSSPGYVGTYEWLGVASLGLLGVPREEALAFSILLHGSWYVPTTLAGGIALGVRVLRASQRRRTAREAHSGH